MQAPAALADALDQGRLDHHVNVFQALVEGEFSRLDVGPNTFQTADDLLAFLLCNQANLSQHGGMRDAAGDVLAVQSLVIRDRFNKTLRQAIGRLANPRLPRLFVRHARHCKNGAEKGQGSRRLSAE
jgi:hypothetical protein